MMQKVYFDGSSKGNPGPMTTAVHLNGYSYFSKSGHHGSGTGNHAEYLAAMAAVDMDLKEVVAEQMLEMRLLKKA